MRPSVKCSRRSTNPSAANRSTKRTVAAWERPTPIESMRIESPGMCAINARADAAGPASGARDELARTMSSLIMSANAPKIFRSRGSSIATSICARSIDSKPYPCGAGRQARGEKAGFTEAYDTPAMTLDIESPLFRSWRRTECRYLAAIDRCRLPWFRLP